MVRKIAIVDESNPDCSATRAISLLRCLEEAAAEAPPPPHSDISWEVEICPAKDLSQRIKEFWLAWIHDGWDRSEFNYAKEAVIAQERKSPPGSPYSTLIVFYGGGAESLFPNEDEQDDPVVQTVASRMVWLQECELTIEDFSYGDGNRLNFEGFLLAAADSLTGLSFKELKVLCRPPEASDKFHLSSLGHTAKPAIRTIEKDMLAGIRGDLIAKERFLGKAQKVLQTIDTALNIIDKVDKDDITTPSLSALSENFPRLKMIVEKVNGSSDWNNLSEEEISILLSSVNAEIATLQAIANKQEN